MAVAGVNCNVAVCNSQEKYTWLKQQQGYNGAVPRPRCPSAGMPKIPAEHQVLAAKYITQFNTVSGILLWHGLGSGKTISSILSILMNDSSAIITMPPSLVAEYRKSIANDVVELMNYHTDVGGVSPGQLAINAGNALPAFVANPVAQLSLTAVAGTPCFGGTRKNKKINKNKTMKGGSLLHRFPAGPAVTERIDTINEINHATPEGVAKIAARRRSSLLKAAEPISTMAHTVYLEGDIDNYSFMFNTANLISDPGFILNILIPLIVAHDKILFVFDEVQLLLPTILDQQQKFYPNFTNDMLFAHLTTRYPVGGHIPFPPAVPHRSFTVLSPKITPIPPLRVTVRVDQPVPVLNPVEARERFEIDGTSQIELMRLQDNWYFGVTPSPTLKLYNAFKNMPGHIGANTKLKVIAMSGTPISVNASEIGVLMNIIGMNTNMCDMPIMFNYSYGLKSTIPRYTITTSNADRKANIAAIKTIDIHNRAGFINKCSKYISFFATIKDLMPTLEELGGPHGYTIFGDHLYNIKICAITNLQFSNIIWNSYLATEIGSAVPVVINKCSLDFTITSAKSIPNLRIQRERVQHQMLASMPGRSIGIDEYKQIYLNSINFYFEMNLSESYKPPIGSPPGTPLPVVALWPNADIHITRIIDNRLPIMALPLNKGDLSYKPEDRVYATYILKTTLLNTVYKQHRDYKDDIMTIINYIQTGAPPEEIPLTLLHRVYHTFHKEHYECPLLEQYARDNGISNADISGCINEIIPLTSPCPIPVGTTYNRILYNWPRPMADLMAIIDPVVNHPVPIRGESIANNIYVHSPGILTYNPIETLPIEFADPIKYQNSNSKMYELYCNIRNNPTLRHIIYADNRVSIVMIGRMLAHLGYKELKIPELRTNATGRAALLASGHAPGSKPYVYMENALENQEPFSDSTYKEFAFLTGKAESDEKLDAVFSTYYEDEGLTCDRPQLKLPTYTVFPQRDNKSDLIETFNNSTTSLQIVIFNNSVAEGISLKNVDFIHVFTLPPSISKLRQIFARGIRTCSRVVDAPGAPPGTKVVNPRPITPILYLSKLNDTAADDIEVNRLLNAILPRRADSSWDTYIGIEENKDLRTLTSGDNIVQYENRIDDDDALIPYLALLENISLQNVNPNGEVRYGV